MRDSAVVQACRIPSGHMFRALAVIVQGPDVVRRSFVQDSVLEKRFLAICKRVVAGYFHERFHDDGQAFSILNEFFGWRILRTEDADRPGSTEYGLHLPPHEEPELEEIFAWYPDLSFRVAYRERIEIDDEWRQAQGLRVYRGGVELEPTADDRRQADGALRRFFSFEGDQDE